MRMSPVAAIFILFMSMTALADAKWVPHLNGVKAHLSVQFVSNNLPESYVFPVTRLSSTEMDRAFQLAKAMPLPFEHTKECCFDRAYKISENLVQRGISHLRIFVRGDKIFGPFLDKWNRKYTWEVHTASAIVDSENRMWILDPALAKEPLLLRAWMDRFTSFNDKVSLTIANHFSSDESDLDDSYANTFDRPNVQELVNGNILGCMAIVQNNNDRWNPETKTLDLRGKK